MSSPVEELADHLAASCDAAIVVDGNADAVIERMLAAGWTWTEGRGTEIIGGTKRVRYLTAPHVTSEVPA